MSARIVAVVFESSSLGSRVEQRLAFQRLASANNLLGRLLMEVSSGLRRTNGDWEISGGESTDTKSSSVLIA